MLEIACSTNKWIPTTREVGKELVQELMREVQPVSL